MASSTVASVTSMITSIMPSATSVEPPTSTTASAPPAASTTGSGQSPDDSGSGRPLLFFVALGFGVVFTNLWIIVGIKYCFRYNRRMRAGLLSDENGEPIDLNTMPGHRPRRRREKKLMSMDEVNERFPLTRYKMWKSAREQEGLAPEGGVTAPASRPASIHAASAAAAAAEGRASADSKKSATVETAPAAEPVLSLQDSEGVAAPSNATSATATAATAAAAAAGPANSEKEPAAVHNEHVTQTQSRTTESELEDDEPDPIHEPIHPNIAGFYPEEAPAGDACAICIDVLEDDDEVRGLTCGHAFHAGCLDPWLTARRACCPLCKADYYVPKPRAEGDAGGVDDAPEGSRLAIVSARHGGAMMMPHFPGRTRRMLFGGPANPSRIRAASAHRPPAYDPQAMRQPGDSMGARAMHWFRTIPENLPSIGMRPAQGARAAQSTATDLEAAQPART